MDKIFKEKKAGQIAHSVNWESLHVDSLLYINKVYRNTFALFSLYSLSTIPDFIHSIKSRDYIQGVLGAISHDCHRLLSMAVPDFLPVVAARV